MKKTYGTGRSGPLPRFCRGSAGKVPGCLYAHHKTGGYYWQLQARFAPPEIAGNRKVVVLPMVPVGLKHATRQKSLAEACRKRLWAEWHAKSGPVARDHVSSKIFALIADFAEWNLQTARPQNAGTNRAIIEAFIAAQGIASALAITTDAIEAHLAKLRVAGRSLRTIQKHRNALRKFCRWLVRRGVLETNPAAIIELRAPVKRPPRYLNEEQIVHLLARLADAKRPWLLEAVCVALYEGPRLSEIVDLKWQHILGNAIVFENTKTGDYRTVPIFPEIQPVLAAMKRGKPDDRVFPCNKARWWVELLKEHSAGIEPFGRAIGVGRQWHLLRSTWATMRARGIGLDHPATLWELMSWGGWKSPTTVMRYVSIATVKVHASMFCGR